MTRCELSEMMHFNVDEYHSAIILKPRSLNFKSSNATIPPLLLYPRMIEAVGTCKFFHCKKMCGKLLLCFWKCKLCKDKDTLIAIRTLLLLFTEPILTLSRSPWYLFTIVQQFLETWLSILVYESNKNLCSYLRHNFQCNKNRSIILADLLPPTIYSCVYRSSNIYSLIKIFDTVFETIDRLFQITVYLELLCLQ